jgi:predicted RNA-binding protein (virulence factor B family)
MAMLGKYNSLTVLRVAHQGLYLDGENLGDIMIPNSYVPAGTAIGSVLDVFVYCDSDDRLIATTLKPRAQVGEFACLQVVSEDERIGAFLDWGLNKDLLLPRREQERRLRAGDWVVVYILVDERSGRLIASARLNRYLNLTEPSYREGEKVNLLIMGPHELGYQAIVEGAHRGLLYHTDLRVPLYTGQRLEGYVKRLREDGKIDLSLDPAGYSRVAPLADRILAELKAKGGRLPFDDSSSPEDIRAAFSVSKKSFKQAIGSLFKQRLIVMLEHGIALPFDKPDR